MGFWGHLFGRAKPADRAANKAAQGRRQVIRRSLYDFGLEQNYKGGQKRRPSRPETTGEDGIMTQNLRYRAINLARDSERNYPSMAAWLNTLKVSVVGDAGKLKFNHADPWCRGAAAWFNRRWSKHCDFRDGSSWRETLQNVVAAIMREGDLVVQFDRALTGSGKLLLWESDQICNLDEQGFATYAAQGMSQTQGIIKDRFGRICGVIVTNVRGAACVTADKAFVLMMDPNDPDSADWRLVRRKWRLVQDRGTGMVIPAITGVVDSAEILNYELQTAKQAASRYAAITEAADAGGIDLPGGFDEIEGDAQAGAAQEGAGGSEDPEEELDDIGHAYGLERFCGGNVDYLPNGSSIAFDPANRPNGNLPAFLDFQSRYNGGSMGLIGSLATGKVESSYSGFRGEMCLTWMTFRSHQQFLEDVLLDWVARKAVAHGIEAGDIEAPPEELEWAGYIAWTYPQQPQIDGAKEQDAIAKKLRNGLTSYRDELGADWREKLAELAEELAYARSIGLNNLSPFDGAPAEPAPAPDGNGQD